MAFSEDGRCWYGFVGFQSEPLTNKHYDTLDFNFLSNRIDCSSFRIWRNSGRRSFYRPNYFLHLLSFAGDLSDHAFCEKGLEF